jgi:hypothetical protein
MKIIGQTGSGFIAEVTEEEIAVALGFRGTYDDAFKAWAEKIKRGGRDLPVGTVVQVKEISAFWHGLLYREEEAKKAAGTLRALADLITANMPSGIVPPAPPKEGTPDAQVQA